MKNDSEQRHSEIHFKVLHILFGSISSRSKSLHHLLVKGEEIRCRQHKVTLKEIDGKQIIVKRNRISKFMKELILDSAFVFLSLIVGHPSMPFSINQDHIDQNECDGRNILQNLGIKTPKILKFEKGMYEEEYVNEGDLYYVFDEGSLEDCAKLSSKAGTITAIMHRNGFVFMDNTAYNYLVQNNQIYRTDVGLFDSTDNTLARSLDIGTFLASVMDLQENKYQIVRKNFLEGYKNECDIPIPPMYNVIADAAYLFSILV